MTLSGFALFWFILSIGCVLAGTMLTWKRAAKWPPASREEPLRASKSSAGQKISHMPAICWRCAQPLERDARFCGACGLHLGSMEYMQKTQAKLVRRV